MTPSIRCWYYVRDSLSGLARQYFRYGFWRVKTLTLHPDSVRWRQLVAPLFVVGVLASIVLLVFHCYAVGSVVPGLYGVVNLFASLRAAGGRRWRYLPMLPVIFAIMHVSWGSGFLLGLVRWGIPRFRWRSLINAFRWGGY